MALLISSYKRRQQLQQGFYRENLHTIFFGISRITTEEIHEFWFPAAWRNNALDGIVQLFSRLCVLLYNGHRTAAEKLCSLTFSSPILRSNGTWSWLNTPLEIRMIVQCWWELRENGMNFEHFQSDNLRRLLFRFWKPKRIMRSLDLASDIGLWSPPKSIASTRDQTYSLIVGSSFLDCGRYNQSYFWKRGIREK